MNKGIVLSAPDKTIEARAKSVGLGVVVDPARPLAFEKTLFTEPGTGIPFDLLSAAWHFLERWDAAIPLWRYGANADQLGTSAERKRTKAVIRDLRVMSHSTELLFIRDNELGRALHETWLAEMADGGDKRLAFLRAYYRVKPRCCVLPRSWLAEVAQGYVPPKAPRHSELVQVEIGPGRFVRCRPENVERVKAQFERGRRRR